MSIAEIERFAADVSSNAVLRAEAEKAAQATSIDDVIAFATAKGYGFTANDVGQFISPVGKMLSEGELDSFAGGGWNIWATPQLMPLALLLGIKG